MGQMPKMPRVRKEVRGRKERDDGEWKPRMTVIWPDRQDRRLEPPGDYWGAGGSVSHMARRKVSGWRPRVW